ncbi:hypothetical protein MKX01_039567 [Papaver californicum]|nr:hypothetical protein MKX01_039567 [Papaver californicum]
MGLEEGKDSSIKLTPSRVLPLRLLQFFVVFMVLGVGFSILSMNLSGQFGIQNVVYNSRIQSCEEESPNLNRWIKPPSKLMHRMSDEELFWRASFVPRVKEFPFKRVPKIAFMFLTRGPLPLSPLWEKFLKGHEELYSIFIHSLPSYRDDFRLDSPFYGRQIPSKLTEWGTISLCDAERRLLANALLDMSNERFVLVSESCIPIHNFTVVYQYLMESKHSFIQIVDDPGQYGRGRYNHSMAPDITLEQWRKGSQWFEVNRQLAINIVEDITFYPLFNEFCKPDCYVDEHYFPTMLQVQVPHLLANRSVTWVDWSRGGAHPARFGKSDITEDFLKRMLDSSCFYNDEPSNVCQLFARKFAPNALEPLLKLAPKILGF